MPDEQVVVEKNITLEAVRAAKPTMIWYGANTCWWTHRPEDLAEACDVARERAGPRGDLPTDPRGGVLFEAHKPEHFLRNAEGSPNHYGKHGLDAFMAAHHRNCRRGGKPWCLKTWQEYNDVLDQG